MAYDEDVSRRIANQISAMPTQPPVPAIISGPRVSSLSPRALSAMSGSCDWRNGYEEAVETMAVEDPGLLQLFRYLATRHMIREMFPHDPRVEAAMLQSARVRNDAACHGVSVEEWLEHVASWWLVKRGESPTGVITEALDGFTSSNAYKWYQTYIRDGLEAAKAYLPSAVDAAVWFKDLYIVLKVFFEVAAPAIWAAVAATYLPVDTQLMLPAGIRALPSSAEAVVTLNKFSGRLTPPGIRLGDNYAFVNAQVKG